VQAYSDSATLGAAFKALGCFEGLLERAIIAADVRQRASGLLTTLFIDLRKVSTSLILILQLTYVCIALRGTYPKGRCKPALVRTGAKLVKPCLAIQWKLVFPSLE